MDGPKMHDAVLAIKKKSWYDLAEKRGAVI